MSNRREVAQIAAMRQRQMAAGNVCYRSVKLTGAPAPDDGDVALGR
jgi:hypothetical protein